MTFRLALFGAPPDTPNMGVSALFASAVEGVTKELGDVEWVVFDNGLGRRTDDFRTSDGRDSIPLVRFGSRVGRRYYRPENLAVMQFFAQLGPFGRLVSEAIRLVDSCDAVLDVSGGDSFSDIYGWKRFNAVYWTKRVALSRGKPLILLPQTYGPYREQRTLDLAKSVVGKASMAWARDPGSFEIMKSLLGGQFDPIIHRQGVDMAFGLQPREPANYLPSALADWLLRPSREIPLIGINVSGLIYNDPDRARTNYHFVADYRTVIEGVVTRFLRDTDARIVLVSHVMDRPGHYESDIEACLSVARKFGGRDIERLVVAPIDLDQSEAKWLISKFDWFCGTRMHATIAGLSSGVPTAAVAYSDKTLGVFATCGQAAQVFDPRKLDTDVIITSLMQSFAGRDALRQSLLASLPTVREIAFRQMHDVAAYIRDTAGRHKAI